MNNYTNICIVITGLILEEYIHNIISSYKDFPNKIISTWKDQNEELINRLSIANFIIVQSDYPSYNSQTNYQSIASYNGSKKAEELGFEYIIKIRSDILCNNINKFVEILNNKFDKDKLIIFAGMKYHGNPAEDRVCIMDNMIAGYINNIIKFYSSLQISTDVRFPEEYLQESYLNKQHLSKDEIRNTFYFCHEECSKNNITFLLTKKQYNWEFIEWRCKQRDIWS